MGGAESDFSDSLHAASTASTSTPSLYEPILNPNVNLFQDWTAKQPVTLVMKQRGICLALRHKLTITFASSDGGPGETILFEVLEEHRHNIVFRTSNGQEVMRIRKNAHYLTYNHEYSGMKPDGQVVWSGGIHRKLTARTKYDFTIYPPQQPSQTLEFKDKILGHDKGLLLDGQVLAAYSDLEVWSLKRRQYVVKVAPGMDMLVALGMAYIRYDKLRDDKNNVVVPAPVT